MAVFLDTMTVFSFTRLARECTWQTSAPSTMCARSGSGQTNLLYARDSILPSSSVMWWYGIQRGAKGVGGWE